MGTPQNRRNPDGRKKNVFFWFGCYIDCVCVCEKVVCIVCYFVFLLVCEGSQKQITQTIKQAIIQFTMIDYIKDPTFGKYQTFCKQASDLNQKLNIEKFDKSCYEHCLQDIFDETKQEAAV